MRSLLAMAGLLLAMPARGQAWSPDGKCLAWSAIPGVAVVDLTTMRAKCLFDRVSFGGEVPAVGWTEDSSATVFATLDRDGIRVHVVPLDGSRARVFACGQASRARPALAVRGNHAFVAVGETLLRLDLTTGEHCRRDDPAPLWKLQRAGERVLYTAMIDEHAWDIGEVTADTLALRHVRHVLPGHDAWQCQPSPVFAPQGERFAVPALKETGGEVSEGAVLVFRGDQLDAVLPMTAGSPMQDGDCIGIGDLAWRSDGAMVYVGVERMLGLEPSWHLREVPLGVGITRETFVAAGPSCRCGGLASWRHPSLALSPDGSFAALHCWMGLFVVDLTNAARPVRQIPFPGWPPPGN